MSKASPSVYLYRSAKKSVISATQIHGVLRSFFTEYACEDHVFLHFPFHVLIGPFVLQFSN